jgi:hypothetical protein
MLFTKSIQARRIGDLDLPAVKLERVVHEAGAIHRLIAARIG